MAFRKLETMDHNLQVYLRNSYNRQLIYSSRRSDPKLLFLSRNASMCLEVRVERILCKQTVIQFYVCVTRNTPMTFMTANDNLMHRRVLLEKSVYFGVTAVLTKRISRRVNWYFFPTISYTCADYNRVFLYHCILFIVM